MQKRSWLERLLIPDCPLCDFFVILLFGILIGGIIVTIFHYLMFQRVSL